jgi:hypothetical protein
MRQTSRSARIVAIAVFIVASSLPGCGGPTKVKVQGRVTQGGQPLKVSRQTQVTITFAPAVEKAQQTYSAKFDRDLGVFTAVMPPGQYKAGILVTEQGGDAPKVVARADVKESKTYDISSDQKIDLELERDAARKD